MNEFYSIGLENVQLVQYQLRNLGKRINNDIYFTKSRQSGGGVGNVAMSQNVNSENYDALFAFELSKIKPVYEIENMLNYHLDFYLVKGGSREKFFKHMRYVILPRIQKMYEPKVYVDVLQQWLKDNEQTKNMKQNLGDINGSNNIVNIAGGTINQSDVSIIVSTNHYNELRSLGVEDKEIEELKEIVKANAKDKPTLKTNVFKWLSAVTVSIASKGLVDNLPKLHEFVHHLVS